MFFSIIVSFFVFSTSFNFAAAGGLGQQKVPRQQAFLHMGLRTNTAKRLIDLREMMSGGPGKEGIPAIDNPRFVPTQSAKQWLAGVEPVISAVIDGQAKAYPLQILIWHELVNDTIARTPVVVSFCPLCYTAHVYDRRIGDNVHTFGVSGMLRNSNMVMYDRQTETLWQEITGEAIVGDMLGSNLVKIPAQIISFDQFAQAYPKGMVLSRKTGFAKPYGQNPYTGYDNINNTPFLFRGRTDNRLPPMEKLITIEINNETKAYPYLVTQNNAVINDNVGGTDLVIFHIPGAVSAMDSRVIVQSKQIGSTGVFKRKIDNQILTFRINDKYIIDEQTKSVWDITGKAVKGNLKGKQLKPVVHGNYFAFVWLVFKPQTKIYTETKKSVER